MTTPSSAHFMTAMELTQTAKLGSLIRFTDFAPAPPARFKRKHDDWSRNNNSGRLISVRLGNGPSETSFTLHMGDYGADGIVIISARKTFMGYSALRFAIMEPPIPGSIAIVKRTGPETELLHLATTPRDASHWIEMNPSHGEALQIAANDTIS